MIAEAIIIGIVAWVFVIILMKPEMAFSWWWNILDGFPHWLAYPLGRCEYCLAGQLSLWYFLFSNWNDYNVFYHIAYISIAIFTVKIINQIKWN